MDSLTQDVRYGLRTLLSNPGFTAVAVIALALGIGANTAIFSVLYGVLLRPLPYRDADRLVIANISVPDYRDLREGTQVFDETAIWATNRYNLSGEGEPEVIMGAVVSPGFFPLLGDAMIGRTFAPAEDREPLAVISHDLWQRRFGGGADVLGQTITLSGKSHTVVGVMPPEFHFPGDEFKVWVTFGSAMGVASKQAENRQLRIFRALARLRSGVTLQEAQADVARVSALLQKDHPDTNAGVNIRFTPLQERLLGDVRPALLVLMGAVAFVLLIACANVANLLLARTTARSREIAIRAALGASQWRVARQLLTESVVLALAGGLLGLLLALWGVDVLPRLDPGGIPRLDSVGVNLPVLLFTLGVSVLTGVLFGLAPALQVARGDLHGALKEGGRGQAGGRWGNRSRGALVVVELSLSLVVLVGAGLLIQSFVRLLGVEPGFVAENLVTSNVLLIKYEDPRRRADVLRSVVENLERLPGVVAAGGGTGLPPRTPQRGTRFEAEGQPAPESGAPGAYFIAVTPHHFRALGTPLVAGRAFDERDTAGAPQVAIVNYSLARNLWPGEDPIGKRLRLINPEQSNAWRTVVGVVGDVRYSGLDDPGEAAIYTPFAQTPFIWSYLMVRTAGASPTLGADIRAAIRAADPTLDLEGVVPMSRLVSQAVAQPRFYTLLLTVFAAVAVLLAAVGLYGVMAYNVTRRTREIGIRMALGARPADVLRQVIGQGLLLALCGVALGVGGALAATRLMSHLLFGVGATHPPTFIAVAVVLTLVALAACVIPARRATRVDPMVALRSE